MPDTTGKGSISSDAVIFTQRLNDIASASEAIFPIPGSGRIVKVMSVLHDAISTADQTIAFSKNGTADTTMDLTIANASSAEGDIDEVDGNVPVVNGDYIKLESDGSTTGPAAATFTVVMVPTGV